MGAAVTPPNQALHGTANAMHLCAGRFALIFAQRCTALSARERGVSATSEAWSTLQGGSPCRVRASHSPVSSLAHCAELKIRII